MKKVVLFIAAAIILFLHGCGREDMGGSAFLSELQRREGIQQDAENGAEINEGYRKEAESRADELFAHADIKAGESYASLQEKTGDIYDSAMDGLASTEAYEGDFFKDFYTKGYLFWSTVKFFSPYILVFSVVTGIICAKLATKNKALRRKMLVSFCVLIPVLVLTIVFGPAIISGIFY